MTSTAGSGWIIIVAVEHELAQVAELFVTERPALRGVARAYYLLAGPSSPLYGHDVRALREELDQIRFLLQASPPLEDLRTSGRSRRGGSR